jgi:hypothetical protein
MMTLRARVRLLARRAAKTANLVILDAILAPLPEGENGFLVQTGKLRAAVADAHTTDVSMAFGSGNSALSRKR